MIGARAAPIGSIVAERAPLTTTFEPRRQPILITTFGRTGSMLLMRLLSSHPDVLSYRPHRFEQRIAGYWIEALLALSDPASYLRGVTPQTVARQGVEDRTWWLGIDAPTPWPLRDEAVQDWLGGEAVEALAETCQQRIDAVYETIATSPAPHASLSSPRSRPRVSLGRGRALPERPGAVPGAGLPRHGSSMLAFNEQRGVSGFGRAEADSDVDFVDTLGGQATSLAHAWERRARPRASGALRGARAGPGARARRPARSCGSGLAPGHRQGMLAQLEEDIPELREHATSDSAQSSIGRWRTDLDPELAEACERAFGPALELFGYERQ